MNISIPPQMLAALEAALGQPLAGLAPTFGGASNTSVLASVGGVPCAIKLATAPAKRADLRHEAQALGALAALPGLPRLHAIHDDTEWTALVLHALPGENGLRVLAEQPAELPALCAVLGTTLGLLHRASPPAALYGAAFSLAARAEHTLAELGEIALEAGLRAPLQTALRHPIWREGAQVVHCDPGLHNTLWLWGTLHLIDWEWAAVGQPLLDLAWLRWALRWRELSAAYWAGALANYTAARGTRPVFAPEAMHALMLGQVAYIITRVRQQPAALAEWQRRAVWTLALREESLWNE